VNYAIQTFAQAGGEWVLYVLIALSVWSFAVILERMRYFRRLGRNAEILEGIPALLAEGEMEKARQLAEKAQCPEGGVLVEGLSNLDRGFLAAEHMMERRKLQEKMGLEKNLLILGTLGNNTPFVGLFGTVLGIIRAFHDLGLQGASGSSAVMAGISEALVSTAFGLFIAIPAVAAFNKFLSDIKRTMSNSDRMIRAVLAYAPKR